MEKPQTDELSQADFDYNDVLAPVDEDIPEDLLGKIKYTHREILRLAIKARELIKELLQVKSQFEHLTKTAMPELMKEAGSKHFDCGGVPIQIKEITTASIPAPGNEDPEEQARRIRCLTWLDKNKFGKLIKRQFKVDFERTAQSQELAAALVEFLHAKKLPFVNASTVHHQTLQAFARQCLENGIELPEDFRVKQIEQAVLPSEYRVKWNDLAKNVVSEE